jgi:lysophospholipase L1-like esterase
VKSASLIACAALAATVVLGAPALFNPAKAETGACAAPPELTHLQKPLMNAARAIRERREVTIVAMGSSSTAGTGASDPTHTYPAVLERELKRRWPEVQVTVINAGVGGEEVGQMVDRFGRDLLPRHPDLVIWQLGTNLMLRSGTMESFADSLHDGLKTLVSLPADIVLMDPQFVPRVLVEPLHARVVNAIAGIAQEAGADVFPRFAIMRSWVAAGEYQMDDFTSPDQLHMNDVGYGCLAQLMADAVESAVKAASPATTQTARIR